MCATLHQFQIFVMIFVISETQFGVFGLFFFVILFGFGAQLLIGQNRGQIGANPSETRPIFGLDGPTF